jgi:carbamoyl-phosphate synthase large subunit
VTQAQLSDRTPATRRDTCSVLLTGVGGIVGQGILKCLAKSPHRVMGADASELAAGLYAAHGGFVIPKVHDSAYLDHLIDLCAREGITYVFPGLDMELPILAEAAGRFRDRGVVPIISSPEVVRIGDDKLATARFLESGGFPAPRTFDLSDPSWRGIDLPLVLKPRRGGSHSQGVFIIGDREELEYRLNKIDRLNYVAQEFIGGDEYSAGSMTFDGKCFGVLVMRRTLRDGDTHKAFVYRDDAVESFIARVAEKLRPFGPCNFQFRLKNGVPHIFEINPRVSGGCCIRACAGFNEPLMTLDYLERGSIAPMDIRPVCVFRYWTELTVEQLEVANTRVSGSVQDSGRRL